MHQIQLVNVHQLALWIFRKEKVAVLDMRSFREYHTSHITSALNLGGDRAFKRKLLANSHALAPFMSLLIGVTVENLHSFKKIVLYDQCSAEQPAACSDSFTQFIISQTSELFPNAVLLQGGFLGFRAAYPQLCWQHPDKLPDEEFVGVKADSGLENLLQECLYKLYPEAPSASLSPGERSTVSTRQPSSCSSCGSSSSQRSTDSGVFLTSDVPTNITSTVSRKCVTRVTSAYVKRPNTVVASLSVDDVIMAESSSRRPLRLRPNTLSLCPTWYSTSTTASTTCSSIPDPTISSSSSTSSSRCLFASSYQFLSTASPPSPIQQPLPPPSSRPASTVSAALSAEAFESPLPTAVLPYLLIGCQADAMSAKVCHEFGITHVINVSADGETSPHVPPARFLRIPIDDNGKADMVPYFDKAFAFLGHAISPYLSFVDAAKQSGGRVLIHCFAGISRSPTLAIAYLMHIQRLTFNEAYNRVKSIRPKISPNFNFIGQLTDFEKKLNIPTSTITIKQRSSSCSMSLSTSPQPPPLIIVPTIVSTQATIPPLSPSGAGSNSETTLKPTSQSISSTSTVSTMTAPVAGPSRPGTLSLRRPTLKPLVVVGSKKRDRSQYLSLNISPPSDNPTPGVEDATVATSTSTTATSVSSGGTFVGWRKRSRFGPLLPSPSTAIAGLDLSSPTDDSHLLRMKSSNSPPPPPPSPRPRCLRRSSPLYVESTRRFSLSTFSELQFAGAAALAAAAAAAAVVDTPSSDIDSTIDLTASNPTLMGCGLQSPSTSTHRWILGDSCRHQQATAESSCHSSLSSSSNSQHTPSFPIS